MAGLSERIYARVPVWAQNLAISAYGLTYRHERLGGRFQQYVAEFEARDRYSKGEMDAHVEEQLGRILAVAFDQVPYYRERWRAAGLSRSDVLATTRATLPRLPLTPKDDLRRSPDDFVSQEARSRGGLHRYYTSGSTGTPITTMCTSDGHRRFLAAREVRSFNWAGSSILTPRAMIGGRMVVPDSESQGPFYRYNMVERQVYFSAYHITPAHAPDYVSGLNRYRPRVFTGYAHSYYFLARIMLARNLSLDYEPDCLILSSEKTTPEMKEVMQRAFRARAFEEYGSVENCVLATECSCGSLHVSPDFGIVEIVDERGLPVPPGSPGRLLCTGLLNESQPLIRYDIGDIATWARGDCACGRSQLPVLEGIEGRLEDTVVGPDGRELVRFHGLFINLANVLEAQVVQESQGHLRVRVVGTPMFCDEDRLLIEKRVHDRLGPRMAVTIENVPEIERTGRGKFRAVVSRLGPQLQTQSR